jgi:hypothetical protein
MQLTEKNHNPNYDFYKKYIPWSQEFVKNNIDIVEKNYNLFPNRNRWNCNCHVVHDNDFDVTPIDFAFLRSEYEKIVNNFCKDRNLKSFDMSDIWYNYYKEQQYQEPHIHDGNGYTSIHYLIFDSAHHQPTKFTSDKIITPKIRSGDILFFPASYEHYVPKNESNSPRLTVAFTFDFE